jgi:DNA-directed RNA polymerase specialized sigma subunit
MDTKQRDYQIYEMRTKYYMTMTAIGKRVGLSRERVRQIVKKVGENLGDYKNVQNIRASRNR